MKIKVLPFTEEASHYVIYYKRFLFWHRLERAYLGSIDLSCTDQPELFRDFERACERAKELTSNNIKAHNKHQELLYNNHVAKLQYERLKRYKTKTFETK